MDLPFTEKPRVRSGGFQVLLTQANGSEVESQRHYCHISAVPQVRRPDAALATRRPGFSLHVKFLVDKMIVIRHFADLGVNVP